MSDTPSDHRSTMACGIVEGFHRDDLVTHILKHRPEQQGEWLVAGQPPVERQRVKVQVWTDAGEWGILTGRIIEIGDGFVIATGERTTDNDADVLPGGPYLLTLRYDETMEFPWVLTHAELSDSSGRCVDGV
jgi:hypothetical protein